jgi:hypothetical protein
MSIVERVEECVRDAWITTDYLNGAMRDDLRALMALVRACEAVEATEEALRLHWSLPILQTDTERFAWAAEEARLALARDEARRAYTTALAAVTRGEG